MIGWETRSKMIAERGPRWVVHGTIRRDEFAVHYATTAERAEQLREKLDGSHHRHVTVVPPDGSVELATLGRDRAEAQRVLTEKTAILRAGVLRALDEGRSEVEVARTAGVDRMTVRKWAGKS